jgi:hypothetical protein
MKLEEINQGYTMMHGQQIIKIHLFYVLNKLVYLVVCTLWCLMDKIVGFFV